MILTIVFTLIKYAILGLFTTLKLLGKVLIKFISIFPKIKKGGKDA